MLYIGVDLGTSSMKVLLVNESGAVQKTTSRSYPLQFPQPGWSQQNPDDWWEAFCQCIPELLTGEDATQVAGIAVGGQMHGLVVLDDKDQVIRPAILWNDGRTARETEQLNSDFGREGLLSCTGNIAFAGFTAPKLLWMQHHEPELFAKIQKIMLPKDYLVYRLTGVHSCDMSDASGTLLLDVKNRQWSQPLLDYCGVSTEQMPRLFESYEAVGTVLPLTARALGLPEHTVVAAGAGDNAAAAVGTQTVGNCACNISLGTSGTVFISSNEFRLPPEGNLHAFAHADGSYHLMGCILSAASAYAWWSRDILHSASDHQEQDSISDDQLGKNSVFFLPYLMGERSPHNDPRARALFIGMSMDTKREDMTQAVLEGVAFGLRDSLEVARDLGVAVSSTKICGGGAKSPLWKKMIANIMNLRVEETESEEGPAMGGAILAAVGCGEYQNVEAATSKIVKVVGMVEPEPQLVEKYEACYRYFRTLYPAVKGLYR